MFLQSLFARRYLFSSRSRSVVNLIAGVSVAAVAMPVAAMIVLLSVFNGFEELVRSMYSVFDAELTVTPRRGVTFPVDAVDTAAVARVEGIRGLSFTLEQGVLLRCGGRQAATVLRGVDDAYAELLPLDDLLTAGTWQVRLGDLERLVIGQSMAHALGIRSLADAEVEVYALRRSGFSSLLPAGNYTRREVPVGGVFMLDQASELDRALSSLRLAQQLLGYPGQASSLVAALGPGADPDAVRRQVAQLLGDDFEVRTREELRASFYRLMSYEKRGVFFIALLVLVMASLSVVGALAVLIVEKRGDTATLRALGATTRTIRSLFRAEGYLICLLGALLGVVLGVGAVLVQQRFGIIEIPAETFLTASYPVRFRWGDLAATLFSFAVVAWLLSRLTVGSMIKNNDRL